MNTLQTNKPRSHFNLALLAACFMFALAGCGSGSQNPVRVEQRGDSITMEAKQILADYLPAGSEVINLALDGQKASDSISGWYGSMPVFRTDTVYTFSWGVNEALNSYSDLDYSQSMEYVFKACQGFKCVIEAPWLMTSPRADSPNTVIRYREILRKHGIKYNVPVVFEDNQEHVGDGIHFREPHMRLRAQLLADAILKL